MFIFFVIPANQFGSYRLTEFLLKKKVNDERALTQLYYVIYAKSKETQSCDHEQY